LRSRSEALESFGAWLEAAVAGRASTPRTILIGWVVAVVPSLALFGAQIALGSASLPRTRFSSSFAVYSVVLAPVVETLLLLALAWVARAVFPRRPVMQIAVTGIAFAVVHGITGSWDQAANVAWPALVYAAILIVRWAQSPAAAFGIAVAVHALYNGTFFAVALLAPD